MNNRIYKKISAIDTRLTLEKVHKEYSEKIFIQEFFKEIPIDVLKELIQFKEVNPEIIGHWNAIDADRENLRRLKESNLIEYSCRLNIDNPSKYKEVLVALMDCYNRDKHLLNFNLNEIRKVLLP